MQAGATTQLMSTDSPLAVRRQLSTMPPLPLATGVYGGAGGKPGQQWSPAMNAQSESDWHAGGGPGGSAAPLFLLQPTRAAHDRTKHASHGFIVHSARGARWEPSSLRVRHS